MSGDSAKAQYRYCCHQSDPDFFMGQKFWHKKALVCFYAAELR